MGEREGGTVGGEREGVGREGEGGEGRIESWSEGE